VKSSDDVANRKLKWWTFKVEARVHAIRDSLLSTSVWALKIAMAQETAFMLLKEDPTSRLGTVACTDTHDSEHNKNQTQ
jgi:hypothetical protein